MDDVMISGVWRDGVGRITARSCYCIRIRVYVKIPVAVHCKSSKPATPAVLASSSCCVGACTCHHTGIARHPLPARNNQITGLIFSHYKVPHVLAWAQKTRRHWIRLSHSLNTRKKKRKKRHCEWWRFLRAINCRARFSGVLWSSLQQPASSLA